MLLRLFLFLFICFYLVFSQGENLIDTDSGKDNNEDSGFSVDIVDFSHISKKENFDTTKQTEKILEKSMFIDNWRAILNKGSNFPINKKFSYVKKVSVDKSKLEKGFESLVADNVLGVRLMFPRNNDRAFANVSPAFYVNPFFYKQKELDSKRGFQENVGDIKSINIIIKGKNYPVSVYLVFRDHLYKQLKVRMGNLNFNGWRVLQWKNQKYVQNPGDRVDSKDYPLYPTRMPYLMFEKIVFKRAAVSSGQYVTTDFVCYISKININYDKAVILPDQDDIDDEATWGIYKHRISGARSRILSEYSKIEELEVIERKKMNLSSDSSGGSNQDSDPAAAGPSEVTNPSNNPSSEDEDF